MTSNSPHPETAPGRPLVYEVVIDGHLGSEWKDWFEGLAITLDERGHTALTGSLVDQAALYGLLKKVRDLGIPLISVNPVHIHSFKQKGVSE